MVTGDGSFDFIFHLVIFFPSKDAYEQTRNNIDGWKKEEKPPRIME